MSGATSTRTYRRAECVSFRKTDEAFGGLSNMAPGYPVRVNGVRIFTVEALYQACRFPHRPEVQQHIIGQASPMTAKMVSKPYRSDSRQDWDRVRVKIMRWCLRMKLTQHWPKFSQLLLSTGERPIVEDSRKDSFWGAVPQEDQTLVGMNVLGRLLMELREAIKQGVELRRVEPPAIPNFLFLGKPLEVVDFRTDKSAPPVPAMLPVNEFTEELDFPFTKEVATPPPMVAPLMIPPLPPVEKKPALIEGLKPYSEYRESGQKWLGTIPVNWHVRRTKFLIREVDSRSATGKEQLLRVSQYTGVTQRKAADGSETPDTRAKSLVGYKRVSVNDLVINIMLAWNGSMGVSRYEGIASPAYCVYRLKPGALPWYFHQLFRLPLYKGRIKTASTGIVESRLRLYSDDLGRIEALLPPLDEQKAIVRFLDHANGKINGFIRAKQRLIDLLNEQKQAIIHSAVTRGLNPSVKLKPSGVPWLGHIPIHWEASRSRRLFTVRKDLAKPDDVQLSSTQAYGVIPQSDYEKLVGRRVVRISMHLEKRKHVEKDDFVISMRSFQGGLERAWASGAIRSSYIVLKSGPEVDVEFFSYLLKSQGYIRALQATGDFIRDGQDLTFTNFRMVDLPLVPLTEQKDIAKHIRTATAGIDAGLIRTEREIALMQEYRTRLTNDIVVGKLDVREAAAKLPDLPTESMPEPIADEALEEAATEE